MFVSTHYLRAKHLKEIIIHTHTHTLSSSGACTLTGAAEGILCTSNVNKGGLRLVSIQHVSVIQ